MSQQPGQQDKTQQGKQWLEEMLKRAGLPTAVQVEQTHSITEGSCWLTIDHSGFTPEQTQILTGTEGTVLDAIQYLANTILNIGRAEGEQTAYTIELAGYRVQRQAELQELADAAAHHVHETGEAYEMGALSSAERRQVHTYLKSTYSDLATFSRGKEPDRRLVVQLAEAEEDPGAEV
ncbi:MAG: protein jag [Elainella sp.]